jgi:hypothetical protein
MPLQLPPCAAGWRGLARSLDEQTTSIKHQSAAHCACVGSTAAPHQPRIQQRSGSEGDAARKAAGSAAAAAQRRRRAA